MLDMEIRDDSPSELPPGCRFSPTDEELVAHYLINKVSEKPLPPHHDIQEIHHDRLHGISPRNLVTFSRGEREWYFFIHDDGGDEDLIRIVGDGKGFWKVIGEEVPIDDCEGNVLAMKIQLIYFSGSSQNGAKKTHWKLEKFRLPARKADEWVLARLIRGRKHAGAF